MKTVFIKDPVIAKERYESLYRITNKLSKDRYIEFVEKNSNYFTWLEDTTDGKEALRDINSIPESFREGFLKAHNKTHACAEFNFKKKYYELTLNFNDEFGIIASTFQKKITSKYLDALLLNGVNKEVIDEKVIDSFS